MTSALETCGKPLFFGIANSEDIGLTPPENCKGDANRTFARSLSVMQKEALVLSARTGTAWRLASDEGAYLMGNDVAPCPLAFMTAGMVASYMEAILASAEQSGTVIRDVRLTQDNFYTMKGSALAGTMIGGALPVRLEAEIDSGAGRETLQRLLSQAIVSSPIHGLMQRELENRFTLTHNGRRLATGRDGEDKPAEADPVDCFEAARPGVSRGDLVVKGPLTPRETETPAVAGSSLAEAQNRRLHLRGICSLLSEGMMRVEVQLHSPHGSIFYLLVNRGGTVPAQAPDSATLVSAGIAFCFMTQIGRYAKIVRKDLREYRIVQDTHFSRTGPSEPGQADPVETHVHLMTGEDDEFARTALRMSEQTCFLHALCRSSLVTEATLR